MGWGVCVCHTSKQQQHGDRHRNEEGERLSEILVGDHLILQFTLHPRQMHPPYPTPCLLIFLRLPLFRGHHYYLFLSFLSFPFLGPYFCVWAVHYSRTMRPHALCFIPVLILNQMAQRKSLSKYTRLDLPFRFLASSKTILFIMRPGSGCFGDSASLPSFFGHRFSIFSRLTGKRGIPHHPFFMSLRWQSLLRLTVHSIHIHPSTSFSTA